MDRNLDIDYYKTRHRVALRKESVDRNFVFFALSRVCYVALRKESVDRNLCSIGKYGSQAGVALRKESVDRNVALIPDK